MEQQERRAQMKANEEKASAHHKTFFKGMLKELENHFGVEFPKPAKTFIRNTWGKSEWGCFYVRGGYGHYLEVLEKGTSDKPIRKLAYFKTSRRRATDICIDKRSAGKDWLLKNNIIKPNKWQLVSGIVSEYVLTSTPEGWIAPKTVQEEAKELEVSLAKMNSQIKEQLKSMGL